MTNAVSGKHDWDLLHVLRKKESDLVIGQVLTQSDSLQVRRMGGRHIKRFKAAFSGVSLRSEGSHPRKQRQRTRARVGRQETLLPKLVHKAGNWI